MDRDAGSTLPSTPEEAVPQSPPESVRSTGAVGIVLEALAAILGLVALGTGDSITAILDPARLALVFIGMLIAGGAISMRPDLWWVWLMGAAASGLGIGGLPGHWDSYRLVLGVLTCVLIAGAVLCALPRNWRLIGVSSLILFHFTGIFFATTSPPPMPWVTGQLFSRIFNPYLQFVYLRNAYHFYSPEPGPASILVFLLKTEWCKLTDKSFAALKAQGVPESVLGKLAPLKDRDLSPGDFDKEVDRLLLPEERRQYRPVIWKDTEPVTDPQGSKLYETRWVVLPKRPDDVRDPLGLGYYRLLSLTEQVARGGAGLVMPSDEFEKAEMKNRRLAMTSTRPDKRDPNDHRSPIPLDTAEPLVMQYKLPTSDVTRYILPSYASHIILEYTANKELASKTTVKVYRLEHRNMPADQWSKKSDPYAPTTYRPYFLGEFDAFGNLLNPGEEMLYWMIPITLRQPAPNDPADPFKKPYIDYLSVHALDMKVPDVIAADETKGRVFNWSQLR
jgi:hypothetical protein